MRKYLPDLLWLALLGLFCFALPPTFHGDEPMQIYMSNDFQTAILDGSPTALETEPPYYIDSDQYLRLINGTINRYGIGLGWYLAGMKASDLPPRPGWDWGLSYDDNASTGHVPSPALMQASRFSSTLFLALSAAVMFALGWQLGEPLGYRRPVAYFVSALYTLNPIILLNGRRALQEGSGLFFGVLLIWIAVLIARRRSERKPIPLYLWLALAAGAALALASKYTDIVYLAAAFGWIFFAVPRGENRADPFRITVKLALSGLAALALFIGLSPALWNDPRARFLNMLQARTELIDIQISADPLAPMALPERVRQIVMQPFMTPPQHFEVAFWSNFQTITDDVTRYMASLFSGLQFGVVLGGALTLLAVTGIVVSARGTWRRASWRLGVVLWLLVTTASLLANPLPWQRYYLPLIPVVTLLAGIGLFGLLPALRRRLRRA